jgi:hypothetical protein
MKNHRTLYTLNLEAGTSEAGKPAAKRHFAHPL